MKRATTDPCREVGSCWLFVAPILPVAIYPKPAVGTPVVVFTTCVAAALVEVGFGICARLKTLVNSARTLSVARSLMWNRRPKDRFSLGRRWKR